MQGKHLLSVPTNCDLFDSWSSAFLWNIQQRYPFYSSLSNPTKSVLRSHINTMDLHIL